MTNKKTNKKTSFTTTHSYKGRLEIVKNGMGYVMVEGLKKDIVIRQDKMGLALDGDDVRVEVSGTPKKNGRQDGIITDVIKRHQTEFSGTLKVSAHFAFLIPDKQNMPVDIFIPLELMHDAKDGDKAIVKIKDWTPKAKNPIGEVIHILTNEPDNEIAMKSILLESGFPLSFPDEVLEEAARYPEGISEDELHYRKDFRNTLTVTIDPVDAKDFDDAISFKEISKDVYEVGVHIADVSHYIQKSSALDQEAFRRATSVYLPDRVAPMLPERLSNELCSLRPHEDKYTFSAVFQLDGNGIVLDYWLGKTVIHSDRRFSYEEVQEMIEGADGDHKEVIMTLNSIAQTLRKKRFQKGAINFSSQEVRFQLDENAKPIGIIIKESKEAHQLIEELMLLANKQVATYVSAFEFKGREVPFPYRVHDVPDVDKLKMFTAFAGRFGYKFNIATPEDIAASFNEMLQLVQGKPEQHVLETLGIRTMSKAVYTTDNIGHYGLGFSHYCHFTSPIRRYPDVLVHRVLWECLNNDIKPVKHMEQECRHCSEMERKAMDAERSANKYKQVEYMQQFVGEDFDAVISGVSTFGFWAETVEHKCEGMVSKTDLNDIDDFEFKEDEYALVGFLTGLKFSMGDKIKVKVAAANLEKRQIDFALVGMEDVKLAHRARAKVKSQKVKKGKR